MNTAAFETAIIQRIEADTGTGGIYAPGNVLVSGLFNQWRDPDTSLADKPFLVLTVEESVQDDTFESDGMNVDFTLHLFEATRNGNAAAMAIMLRLYGDAYTKANWLPTYGLHRWDMGAFSGTPFIGGICTRTRVGQNHSRDVYHYMEQFTARVTLNPTGG